jgi:hypothetical protein
MYAFLRYDPRSEQRWLVVANLHRSSEFADVHIHVPEDAVRWLGLPADGELRFTDRLGESAELTAKTAELSNMGVVIAKIPALSAMYFEILANHANSP